MLFRSETAQVLLEKEILEGEALKAKLKRVQTFTGMETWLISGHLSQEISQSASINGRQKAADISSIDCVN